MKRILLASAAILLVSAPVYSQSTSEKTGINSLVGSAPSTEDFVMLAASSDMFEIDSSKLALEKADPTTKSFAQQMITDHQKTSEELKNLVTTKAIAVTIPAALSEDHQEMLDKLEGLQGEDFTKQYRSDQEDVHEDAVDLFKRYAEEGDNADLKTWAASTLPKLQHHLEMAEQLNE
ncbi:DUF305 domain-containing protein [Falsochrobactrum shanghaiense]|uniref:DUF305 domain-containing protein n=1 Tax=Falsochrobactrum shanghaiense TaxID=2201899 RepID=A0A316J3X5_9HYPH|nr:DUF4142 domain-containing protein [Falsochrobactrum shanghaiense]PWL16557.1 DUF305 domain-containing protein [Falsochrobactrum shanghaiense]